MRSVRMMLVAWPVVDARAMTRTGQNCDPGAVNEAGLGPIGTVICVAAAAVTTVATKNEKAGAAVSLAPICAEVAARSVSTLRSDRGLFPKKNTSPSTAAPSARTTTPSVAVAIKADVRREKSPRIRGAASPPRICGVNTADRENGS